LAAVLALSGAAGAAPVTVYKYLDAQGRVVYAERPPPVADAERLDLDVAAPDVVAGRERLARIEAEANALTEARRAREAARTPAPEPARPTQTVIIYERPAPVLLWPGYHRPKPPLRPHPPIAWPQPLPGRDARRPDHLPPLAPPPLRPWPPVRGG
jgi:hypothetical protein